MQLPSRLLENAVTEISRLPGIGKKSALRAVLHLLKQEPHVAQQLAEAIKAARQDIKYCKVCFNLSDDDICSICANPQRDTAFICVVEDLQAVLAIENTGQFRGLYHVLGGVISPINGVGPNDLRIEQLLDRVTPDTREVILALSTTIEGETTTHYITKLLKTKGVTVTQLSRGVSVGSELEYTDEITLGRSILLRVSAD